MNTKYGRRRSIRLKDFNYSQSGLYFITICTASKHSLFCTNSENSVNLSHIGKIARDFWLKIPDHFQNAKLDEFVVMPNHIHGIIALTDNEENRAENIQPLQLHEQNVGVQYIEPSSPHNKIQHIEPSSPQNWFQHIEPSLSRNRFQHMIPKSIGSIVRSYKAAVTRQCRKDKICEIVWQRNFYERIIRNEKELGNLREYIANNPLNWSLDRENPGSENYELEHVEYFGLQ